MSQQLVLIQLIISVTGNASDSGNGGGSTVAAYQIDCGLDTQVGGTGWGSGTWGRSTWGSSFGLGVATELALWNEDNFRRRSIT